MALNPIQPVTLKNEFATLIPLERAHTNALGEAAKDGELWNLWYTFVATADQMGNDIEERLIQRNEGSRLPFTVLTPEGEMVGMTSYLHIDKPNRRVEIGSTWYAARAQRTPLNTACKLLLLSHAFDDLGCIAVEFRTHIVNHRSRRAIERLGAKLDGILRNHQIMPNGTYRDTCVYSIIRGEWPTVKTLLEHKLKGVR
ncbi:MAG: GNAT family protein [Proteobacteria bacterium]|nr:GNAT family protein [Pseudomonadota bacterium]